MVACASAQEGKQALFISPHGDHIDDQPSGSSRPSIPTGRPQPKPWERLSSFLPSEHASSLPSPRPPSPRPPLPRLPSPRPLSLRSLSPHRRGRHRAAAMRGVPRSRPLQQGWPRRPMPMRRSVVAPPPPRFPRLGRSKSEACKVTLPSPSCSGSKQPRLLPPSPIAAGGYRRQAACASHPRSSA